jgi:PAS domain S-box-containing protein
VQDFSAAPVILIGHSDPTFSARSRQIFESAGYAVLHGTSAQALLSALNANPVDILLVQQSMADALDIVARLYGQPMRPLLLCLCPIDDPACIEAAFTAGADDVLTAAEPTATDAQRLRLLLARHRRRERFNVFGMSHDQTLTSIFQIFEHAPTPMALYDPAGNPHLLNRHFRQFFGDDDAPEVRLPLGSIDGLADAARLLFSGQPVERLHVIFSGSAAGRHIELTGSPVKHGERLDGVLISLTDITALKMAEAAEREQREQAEALRDLASLLSQTFDMEAVYNGLLDHIGQVVPHDAATIALLDGNQLRVAYYRGRHDSDTNIQGSTFDPMAYDTYARTLTENATVLVEDVGSYPTWIHLPDFEWIRSWIAVPLSAYGRVLGVLALDGDTPGKFQQRHIPQLQAFADQAAVALEHAQLIDSIYRDAARLRSINRVTSGLLTTSLIDSGTPENLYERLAQIVSHEMPDVECTIIAVEQSGGNFVMRPAARAGILDIGAGENSFIPATGVIARAVHTGDLVYVPDVSKDAGYQASHPDTRAELVVPLLGTQRCLAVIDVQAIEVDAFDNEQIQMLRTLAERAATILENQILYQEIQRRVQERTAELNRVKDRTEAILNNSSDAILLLRRDGRIQQGNKAFTEMFGYDSDELFNQPFERLTGPFYASLLHQTLNDVVATGKPGRLEMTVDSKGGHAFDADVAISPVVERTAHATAVTSVVCSIRDITSRKELERELRTALSRERELSELKSQFISRASHEFRTPLMMIRAATDLLNTHGERMGYEKRVEKMESIQRQVTHLTLMLDELLTLGRAQELGRNDLLWRTVNLAEICESIINDLRAGIGISHVFKVTQSGRVFTMFADERWLRRALTNIFTNAIKYSPPGSLIRVRIVQSSASLEISVQDEGYGIPEPDLQKLFEPFHRGSNVEHISGTGLGLSIVKQAVELHGGNINVHSQLGIGTEFTLSFPIDPVGDRP